MEKLLLILDLDETLVYACPKGSAEKCDFETEKYCVVKRPYLDNFLEFCFSNYQVAIWTTGGEEYAEAICNKIFKDTSKLEFIWSGKRCTPAFDYVNNKTEFLKNLSKVKKKGYPLSRCLMLDNTPFKLQKNYGNLIHVQDFEGEQGDTELLKLIKYIPKFDHVVDVRSIEKRNWRSGI